MGKHKKWEKNTPSPSVHRIHLDDHFMYVVWVNTLHTLTHAQSCTTWDVKNIKKPCKNRTLARSSGERRISEPSHQPYDYLTHSYVHAWRFFHVDDDLEVPNGKEADTSGRNRYNCSQLTSFPHISVCLVYVRDEKSTVALVKVSYYHVLGGDPILNQPFMAFHQPNPPNDSPPKK